MLNIYSNPEQQKEDTEADEYRGNESNGQLFEDVSRELCRRHFIDKEPCHEEDADAK